MRQRVSRDTSIGKTLARYWPRSTTLGQYCAIVIPTNNNIVAKEDWPPTLKRLGAEGSYPPL